MKSLYKISGVAIILVLWQIIFASGLVNPLFLPSPISVAQKLVSLLANSIFLADIFNTLLRTLFGFSIAIVLGVPLGIFMGYSEKIYNMFEFLIDFFRSIPATAMIPLFTLMFGIGDASKILLISFVSLLIIAFNTMYGVKNGKKLRRITGELFGLHGWKLFTKIIFPESLPYIFVGLRVAISSAFVVVVVSEMFIGTQSGLGHRIIDAQLVYDATTMYSAILVAGILGYAINKIFVLLESKVVQWSGK